MKWVVKVAEHEECIHHVVPRMKPVTLIRKDYYLLHASFLLTTASIVSITVVVTAAINHVETAHVLLLFFFICLV